MAVVKAYKWMRFLSEGDEIAKKKEKARNTSPQAEQSYREAMQLRNMAFVELIKAGMPYIYIEDDDIVRINIDETSYDISTDDLHLFVTDEEYVGILNRQVFESGFNANKDINVEEQTSHNFEELRKKILSYGNNLEENDDFKRDRGSTTRAEAQYMEDFENVPKFTEDYEEHYVSENNIIDYRIDKDGKARIVNTTEYAIMGVEHGIGTTHFSMMLAQYLAADTDKSIAIVEINNSNNMRDLGEWISGQRIETNNYPLGNIDVYFNVDYLTFTAAYKDNYDYVVIDFGCYNKKRDVMKEFIRIQNKFIIASGIDWNLPTLEDFYEDFVVDRTHSAVYLIPFLSGDLLKPVEKIVKPNKVFSIPFNINPFVVEPCTENAITQMLGRAPLALEDKSMKPRPKGGLFSRFSK